VGVFGAQVAVAFLEGSVFRDRLVPLLTSILPWPAVREVLVGQYGLVSMGLAYGLAIVLPIVTTFFVAFSVLEDSGYLPRLAVMLAVGWIAARVVPGEQSDFVLELSPLRVPAAGNVLVKTTARVEWYLREALPLFVLGTAVLQVLDRTGGLSALERTARPVVV